MIFFWIFLRYIKININEAYEDEKNMYFKCVKMFKENL